MKKTGKSKRVPLRLFFGALVLVAVALALMPQGDEAQVNALSLTEEQAREIEYLWITDEDRRMLVDVAELPGVRAAMEAGDEPPAEAAGLVRVRLPRGARLTELACTQEVLLVDYIYADTRVLLELLPGGVRKTVSSSEEKRVDVWVNEDNREFLEYKWYQ